MKKVLKFKQGVGLLIILAIVFLAVGCSSNSNNDVDTSSEVITSEQVLTIGMDKNTATLDVLKAPDPLVWFPGHHINETLVYPGHDMKPKALLAESWERIDEVAWRFKLRQGVSFHDGTAFNAEAVKFSLERQQEEGPAWTTPPIKEIIVEDDYRIQIITEESFSPLLEWLMNPVASIVSPTAVQQQGDGYEMNPCGTGPFKVEAFVPEQEVVLVRNDEYWGEKPVLEKVIYKIITDSSARTMALRAGEVDIIRDLNAPEIEAFKNSEYQILSVPGVRTHYFGFNANKDVFKDVRVRKAINHAIDRNAIVEKVLLGYGHNITGIVSPAIPGHLGQAWYPYEPEIAMALFEEAGYNLNSNNIMEHNGTPLEFDIIIQPWSSYWKPAAEVIQAQLQQIGIKVNVQVMERGAFNELRDAGKYDIFASTTPGVHGGADYQLMSRFHSELFGASTHASPGYVNKEIETLLEEARKELKEEKREEMYRKVQEIIYEDAALIPYVHDEEVVIVNSRVKGFQPHSSVWAIDLKGVYVE
ncbi:ABC-type dipeptide transport system, periplasmic component [Clostridium aceticum]|uniref:ABC-type dipeptide transport system, periplasmic component n=1 Tax=Clostridium aceticum TaxID=84022 RepID=A0A0D8ICK1_9CLOT|nr:ABC transporter substrate-binding protein [Clostridium aceticum]AKL96326.1 ABC-type dipeptide transport system, periplasmic component [Clostridium aceticum]KJF26921.1 hypothetical protein TZ02_10295 [Clostridium aceticum]